MDVYSLTDGKIIEMIGETMRRFRLERNMSQKDLAKSAGVALSSVASLEKGQSVSLSTLIPILRTLESLQLLSAFTTEPSISPIAYAKLLDGQKQRKRASVSRLKQQSYNPQ